MKVKTQAGIRNSLKALRLCLILLAIGSAPLLAANPQANPQANPAVNLPGLTHVLVISLDGARPDALLQADTPNIQALAARGFVDWHAQTVFPPATIPAHASMLTGLDVAQHGVDWNDYSQATMQAPTFLLDASEAGYRVGMVVGKEKFRQFHQSDAIDYTFARQGDRSVVDRALELLAAGCEVLFVQFPNPDYFGHKHGWMSAAYLYELRNTDFQVGRILAALDALGLTDETLVILTADHGGHNDLHGQNIPEDMTIPWMLAGPGVIPGAQPDAPIRVTETAALVRWALGLPVPDLESRPALVMMIEHVLVEK